MPLPPPIIPEADDTTQSPGSEASSGYMSTSISAATLSDVYTLSWDLPPPNEEEMTLSPRSETSRSETQVSSHISTPSKPNDTTSESHQRHPNQSEEPLPDLDAGSQLQDQTPPTPAGDAVGSEQSVCVQPLEAQEKETKQTEDSVEEDCKHDATGDTHSQRPVHEETKHPQEPEEDPAPVPCRNCVPLPAPQEQPSSEAPPSDPASVTASSSATEEVPQEETSRPPSLSRPPAAIVNPFTIQKVQSSDLKSFQRILGEQDGKPPQMGRTSSAGAGLDLSVPTETLEIISDTEEGETTAAVVPDWLKEGEFVTVGANKSGTVRYVGPTDFAEGTWVGVELEVPAGE